MDSAQKTILVALAVGAAALSANAAPIGYIDQVSYDNGVWRVKGWACEPNLNQSIQVDLVVAGTTIGRYATAEATEQEVRGVCGTTSANVTHRFSAPYTGALSGQAVAIAAVTSGLSPVQIDGSGQFGLPPSSSHPLAIIQAASRILVYTAHPDDEITLAPILGDVCATRSCKNVVATQGGGPGSICLSPPCATNSTATVRFGEMSTSASMFPMTLSQGTLSSDHTRSVSSILSAWNSEVIALGQTAGLNGIIQNEIDTFFPDVILTFDPRHGTSCHTEHRAVGSLVKTGVDAYSGWNFNKNNLFFLTSKRTDGSLDTPTGLTPLVPTDKTAVVYKASNYISSKARTGWQFALDIMGVHQSQFTSANKASFEAADSLDQTTSLQQVTNYVSNAAAYNICP